MQRYRCVYTNIYVTRVKTEMKYTSSVTLGQPNSTSYQGKIVPSLKLDVRIICEMNTESIISVY